MEENNFDSKVKEVKDKHKRKGFVKKGEILNNVVYKSENLIITKEREGKGELVILGTGYSLSIDENNRITHCDPFMKWPDLSVFRDDTTVLSIYFPFEAKGLKYAGKELCQFANSLPEGKNFILHSKSGICIALTCGMLNERANIVTISTPFRGTIIADQKLVLPQLNWFERKIYKMIFSNHKVDRDITPRSKIIRKANYSALKRHNHINVISTCPNNGTKLIDKLLCFLDNKLSIQGDGIVSVESQTIAAAYTIKVTVTHASSLAEAVIGVRKYCMPLI